MNWKIHLIAGIVFAALAMSILGYEESYLILFLLIPFYALISDIDHKNSKITWIGLGISLLLCIIGLLNQPMLLYFGVGMLATVLISVFIFEHRGFTHSIVFGLIVCSPILYFFTITEFVIVFLVFYSHLAMDGLFIKVV